MTVDQGSLDGRTSGSTRKELVAAAEATAAQFFGTKCVRVLLRNQEAESERIVSADGAEHARVDWFTADYTAHISHRWDQPGLGYPKCLDCGERS